jgi:hypothetical protein
MSVPPPDPSSSEDSAHPAAVDSQPAGEDRPPPTSGPPNAWRGWAASASDRDLAAVVRGELEALVTKHPARETLIALAVRLAETADSPSVDADPRLLPPLSRELRATLGDLLEREEAEEDDLLGPDDVPTAMGHATEPGTADVGNEAG